MTLNIIDAKSNTIVNHRVLEYFPRNDHLKPRNGPDEQFNEYICHCYVPDF